MFSFCFSQNENDTLTYREKVRSGNFQFPFELSENDNIELPVEFQIELDIAEIRGLNIKNTNFICCKIFFIKFYITKF